MTELDPDAEPAGRKYTAEFTFHVRALQFVLAQQIDLEQLDENYWQANVEPAHIYLICRRPKISLVPESVTFTPTSSTGLFRLWDGATSTEVPFEVPNQLGTTEVEVSAEYPGTRFEIRAKDGEVLTSGNSAALMGSFGPSFTKYLGLEVLYVGQSFGFEGSRTAKDRLKSHETLQGIYAEALSLSPDMDIWLALVSFEDPYIFTEIDPTVPTRATEEEEEAHRRAILDGGVSLQQEVNLTEAMLIRYFDPPYNKTFRDTFPNPAHLSYSECYDLDFHSVGVELDTSELRCNLWSAARHASWLHLATFPLHSDEDRDSMFSLFD